MPKRVSKPSWKITESGVVSTRTDHTDQHGMDSKKRTAGVPYFGESADDGEEKKKKPRSSVAKQKFSTDVTNRTVEDLWITNKRGLVGERQPTEFTGVASDVSVDALKDFPPLRKEFDLKALPRGKLVFLTKDGVAVPANLSVLSVVEKFGISYDNPLVLTVLESSSPRAYVVGKNATYRTGSTPGTSPSSAASATGYADNVAVCSSATTTVTPAQTPAAAPINSGTGPVDPAPLTATGSNTNPPTLLDTNRGSREAVFTATALAGSKHKRSGGDAFASASEGVHVHVRPSPITIPPLGARVSYNVQSSVGGADEAGALCPRCGIYIPRGTQIKLCTVCLQLLRCGKMKEGCWACCAHSGKEKERTRERQPAEEPIAGASAATAILLSQSSDSGTKKSDNEVDADVSEYFEVSTTEDWRTAKCATQSRRGSYYADDAAYDIYGYDNYGQEEEEENILRSQTSSNETEE